MTKYILILCKKMLYFIYNFHLNFLMLNNDYNYMFLGICSKGNIQYHKIRSPVINGIIYYNNYFVINIEFYGLTPEKLKFASKDALIMHPGPMNRGIEIESSVADSSQSVITEQVKNGVAIRMALLYLLAGREVENENLN